MHRARKVLVVLGAVAVIALIFGLWTSSKRSERAALIDLPPLERRALYERTLRTLQSICRPENRADGLAGPCRDQAELILQLPECDAACRTLAQEQRALPSR